MDRPAESRHGVLVLAPTGRDAELIAAVFRRASLPVTVVRDARDLSERLLDSDAAVVAEEALTPVACAGLREALSRQELWSDLPMVVLAGANSSGGADLFERLSPAANVTLVERPARPFTLVAVVRAALRARRRQYLMRDHMTQLVAAREEIARQHAELDRARTRLAATLAAAEIGTWVWDVGSDRVVGDRNLASMFGLPEADRAGAPLGAFIARLHPEDRAPFRESLAEALDHADSIALEYRILGPGGETRWMLGRGRIERDASGEPVALPGVAVDITERVRAEQERQSLLREIERQSRIFDTALSATPDFVYVFDLNARFRYANRSLLELWQVRLEDVVGKTFRELGYPNALADRLHRDVLRTIETGAQVRGETEYVSPQGYRGWYEYIFVPARGASGRVEAVAGSTREISQRKRDEEERSRLLESERAARAEAERVSRLKDEFLSTLSHELRTPLNAIVGWADLLRRGVLSEEDQARAVETIGRNAGAQKELIEDLLDMSRIVSGKARLDLGPVDPGAVVRAAVDSIRPSAEERGLTVSLDAGNEGPPLLLDANRFQQVVSNLLGNAVKFTPPGGSVHAELHRGHGEMMLRVRDTGVGIDPPFLTSVFDRFRQADASSTRRHGGLGLGLAIVKQIVEMHGGRVSAASDGHNKGACFEVRLPAVPARAEDEPSDQGAAEVDLSDAVLLVVDDDADGRGAIQRLLAEAGAVVLVADSADAAEVMLAGARIDLLVSDVGMPGRDGLSLIRAVRASGAPAIRAMPAVALTAFARAEDRAGALQAGYDAHLSKPVDSTELVRTIGRLLARRTPG